MENEEAEKQKPAKKGKSQAPKSHVAKEKIEAVKKIANLVKNAKTVMLDRKSVV